MEKSIAFNIEEKNFSNSKNMQSLSLAYVGDGIFDLYVREYILKNHLGKINSLHKKTSTIVNASAQAKFLTYLLAENFLTKEELEIANRAKNKKNNTKAKNATIMEYKLATALEAIFGYNYLEKNFSRLNELFSFIIKKIEDDSDEK